MKNIVFTNLSKAFDDNVVFQNLNLTIPSNSCTAIMGKSGCGKTTLINLLLNTVKPDEGTITGIPQDISIVFQEDRLCETFSVFDNLYMVMKGSKKECRQTILSALSDLNMQQYIDAPVCELSGGLKRRVAILRALLHESSLVIMDEPFKGLDENTKRTVMTYTKEKVTSKTFLLITHSQAEASFFTDNIIEL